MKLQHLIIIFLVIALPVIIILSFYVNLQVDTARLKVNYNAYLAGAAHDTIVAFQQNTVGDKYSTVADTKIRDIEAALNIFSMRMSTSFGSTGASTSQMMAYVPALVFTLYDGYYIYTPRKTWDSNNFRHELKSYVYYTKKYTNPTNTKMLTINYSIDNYVAVYFYNGDEYQSRAGYLEIVPSNRDNYFRDLGLDGDDEESRNTRKYYNDAWDFTEWYNSIFDDKLKIDNEGRNLSDVLKITNNNSALPRVASRFNDEKYDVIKNSLTNNLTQAMYVYGRNTTLDFQMPEFSGEDWDTILNNICFIAFFEGMPVGTTVYNDYTIAVSTENKETVNSNDIYYVGDDGSYHRIWCPHLTGNIQGINKIQFKNQESATHRNVPACYYCMINASNPNVEYIDEYKEKYEPRNYNESARKIAFYSALANEKLKLVKASEYINGSGLLKLVNTGSGTVEPTPEINPRPVVCSNAEYCSRSNLSNL